MFFRQVFFFIQEWSKYLIRDPQHKPQNWICEFVECPNGSRVSGAIWLHVASIYLPWYSISLSLTWDHSQPSRHILAPIGFMASWVSWGCWGVTPNHKLGVNANLFYFPKTAPSLIDPTSRRLGPQRTKRTGRLWNGWPRTCRISGPSPGPRNPFHHPFLQQPNCAESVTTINTWPICNQKDGMSLVTNRQQIHQHMYAGQNSNPPRCALLLTVDDARSYRPLSGAGRPHTGTEHRALGPHRESYGGVVCSTTNALFLSCHSQIIVIWEKLFWFGAILLILCNGSKFAEVFRRTDWMYLSILLK